MSFEYKLICNAESFADKIIYHDGIVSRVRRNAPDANAQRAGEKLCSVYMIFARDHGAAFVRVIAALADDAEAELKIFKR